MSVRLDKLNEVQRAAVAYMDGPQLVFAGAGSGKTRVITFKIARMIDELGYYPWEILALTFTNKAAREMRERVEKLVELSADRLWIGTFHSICLRLLRRNVAAIEYPREFVVYDDNDQERMVNRCMAELNLDPKRFNPRSYKNYINSAKNFARPWDHPDLEGDDIYHPHARDLYKLYTEKMRLAGAMDFGDLIVQLLYLLQRDHAVRQQLAGYWRYLLVDEFQDTNFAQYQLVKTLGAHGNICVVGDDDQSIYRWRGASIRNIYDYENDFPNTQVFKLEQNYRSTQTILRAANHVIERNPGRAEKRLWTENGEGLRIRYQRTLTERHEAEFVVNELAKLRSSLDYPLNEMAVFYRTNAQSRVLEDALRRRNVPYIIVGGFKFYERAEIKDVLAYMKVVLNPKDDISLSRIINNPPRGIGKTTLERGYELAATEKLCLFDAITTLVEQGGGRSQRALTDFLRMIRGLRDDLPNNDALALARRIVDESQLITYLQKDGSHEALSRVENIKELLNATDDFVKRGGGASLAAFLDEVALVADIDKLEAKDERVTLMTIHSAKGLEFGTVFIVGLEEGLFPHFNSTEDEEFEEERRLCYVAITRAKERLFITNARSRRRFNGPPDVNPPSRFIDDIPRELLDTDAFATQRRADSSPFSSITDYRSRSTAPHPLDSDVVIDHSYSQEVEHTEPSAQVLACGARVYHPKFGEGTVQHASGVGPFSRVTVRFGSGGLKKIVAKFLQPL